MITRLTELTFKKKDNYNAMVTYWLPKSHVIPTWCQWLHNPNIKSFFVFNRIFNIFYPKILYALFSAFDLLCINSDITFNSLALAFFWEKILCVLQNQDQTACLMTGLGEKTIYRSVFFLSSGSRARDAL